LIDLRGEYLVMKYRDCLITLNWLALYDTYPVLSGRWDDCEKSIGIIIINYGMKIAVLARKKIVFKVKHDVELERSLEYVTFMAHELKLDPSSGWFDWKTHSAGLKYEFCLAVHEPRIA